MATGERLRLPESHIDMQAGVTPIRRANCAGVACAACRQRLSEYSARLSSRSTSRVIVVMLNSVNITCVAQNRASAAFEGRGTAFIGVSVLRGREPPRHLPAADADCAVTTGIDIGAAA